MFLLDTNVVSELRKVRAGKADAGVALWADSVEATDLYLSVIAVQELEIGILLIERRDPPQGERLRAWLEGNVLPAFEDRILSVDTAVARASARLHVPRPMGSDHAIPLIKRQKSLKKRSKSGLECPFWGQKRAFKQRRIAWHEPTATTSRDRSGISPTAVISASFF